MSWGLAGRGCLAQLLLRKSPQEQRRTRLVIRRQARLVIFWRRPLWWWAIGLAGTGQWRQGVARRAPRHAPRQWARRCFPGTVNLVSLLGCGGRVGSAWVVSDVCQAAVVVVPVTWFQVVNRWAISRR
jgi:hypothetical protein